MDGVRSPMWLLSHFRQHGNGTDCHGMWMEFKSDRFKPANDSAGVYVAC